MNSNKEDKKDENIFINMNKNGRSLSKSLKP